MKFVLSITFSLFVSTAILFVAVTSQVSPGSSIETVYTKTQLTLTSETSMEVNGKIPNQLECEKRCDSEIKISCSSFSYCTEDQKCRISSIFLKLNAPSSKDEVEPKEDCTVFRKVGLYFFDETPGKIPVDDGEKTLSNITNVEHCAVICRNELDFKCRGFQFCDAKKDCLLYTTHILDDIPMKDETLKACKHYTMKYSADFSDMGRIIVIDEKSKTVSAKSFEDCAHQCAEHNDYPCKSINFCASDLKCVLNSVSVGDKSTKTSISETCKNFEIDNPDVKPFFPNLLEVINEPFHTEVEIQSGNAIMYMEEYHDEKEKRTRIFSDDDSNPINIFYFEKNDQLITFTKLNNENPQCEVKSISAKKKDFPKWFIETETGSYLGASHVLRLHTKATPKYAGSEHIRGIRCNIFTAVAKNNDKQSITYYLNAHSWSTANFAPKVSPVRVTIVEGTEKTQVDFISFDQLARSEIEQYFIIPRGIGCEGFKSPSNAPKFPKLSNQITLKAEMYNDLLAEEQITNHVDVQKLVYDGTLKVLMFEHHDSNNLPISQIQDFNTGVAYKFSQNDNACKIGPIKSPVSLVSGGISGSVKGMKDSNELLGLDGNYYYLGKEYKRSILCDVWERTQNILNPFLMSSIKSVITYYVMATDYESVTEGDNNMQAPVNGLYTIYNSTHTTSQVEVNFFDFNSAEGRSFANTNDIEKCYPKEEDRKFVMIYFDSAPDMTSIASKNNELFEIEAMNKITEAAAITSIRIPMIKIYYEPTYISILALILGTPPPMAGFIPHLFADPAMRTDKKKILTVQNAENCASSCLKDYSKGCKGFTICGKDKDLKCFLTFKDISETNTTIDDGLKDCKLYFRTVATTYIDSSLANVVEKLTTSITKKKLNIEITDLESPKKNILTFKSTRIDTEVSPNNWHDVDFYDTVVTKYQLEKTETTIEGTGDYLSTSDCYKQCDKENSMDCVSFSYCKTSKTCRLSSLYLDVEKKSTFDEITNVAIGTDCTVYRKNILRFYDVYPGQTNGLASEKSVQLKSAHECASACKKETGFKCRGFEYCESSRTCALHSTHFLDSTSNPQASGCTHYSEKHSLEFENMGHFVLSGAGSINQTGTSFQECAKTCYESTDFKCQSMSYCTLGNESKQRGTCILNDQGFGSSFINTDLEAAPNCAYYERVRKEAARPPKEEFDNSLVSPGSFAGTVIALMIVGIILGGVGFMGYSYLRSRKIQGDSNVSYTNTT